MKYYELKDNKIIIFNDDVINLYDKWKTPMIIISDGPYGVSGFKGDLPTNENLDQWYEPHIKKWSEKSTAQTTLWFWNTELGWATVHPMLIKYGWKFVNCHIWDKGIQHIAGNSNTKSLRKLPVVTEVCVQYVKQPTFKVGDKEFSMKEWLRYEWCRTGLSFSKTNEAANVRNAATRKYFTKCHLWYSPLPEIFEKIAKYANKHGNKDGKPYFSVDGKHPLTKLEWGKLRAKFKCPIGITNVWSLPPLNGNERIKNGSKAIHLNQKPLKLMELIIETSSELGDVVWEPFGGLATGALAAYKKGRQCLTAEIDTNVFDEAINRLKENVNKN